jgi:hypothetical protein
MNLAPVVAQYREGNWDMLQLDSTVALLVHSICRPFSARRSGWRSPGLKPWAEWREDKDGLGWFSSRKGRWDSARFEPRGPTQAGSLCYIGLRSIERRLKDNFTGDPRNPDRHATAHCSIGFQPVFRAQRWRFSFRPLGLILQPFDFGQKLQNLPYLRAIQPWAESSSPFGTKIPRRHVNPPRPSSQPWTEAVCQDGRGMNRKQAADFRLYHPKKRGRTTMRGIGTLSADKP